MPPPGISIGSPASQMPLQKFSTWPPGCRKLTSCWMPAGIAGRALCGSHTLLGMTFASGGMNGWCAGLKRSNAPVSYIT